MTISHGADNNVLPINDEAKTYVSEALAHPDGHTCTNCRLMRLENGQTVVLNKLEHILSVMSSTQRIIEKVAGEVMPTIESLAANPMIKALGIGAKFSKSKG